MTWISHCRITCDHAFKPLRQSDHPLQALAPAVRKRIEQVAGECAGLFQSRRAAG